MCIMMRKQVLISIDTVPPTGIALSCDCTGEGSSTTNRAFFRGTGSGTDLPILRPTFNGLHAAHVFQVVVKSYRFCSFTAVTRVQIPSGTPTT
jgi:hypothetical protein